MAETSVSNEAIYSARPTLRLGGEEDRRASELLLMMKMEEKEGGMSAVELRFSNIASTREGDAEIAFDANSRLKLGASIEVYAGDETEPREIFRGKITALEADYKIESPPELTVLAEDALQQARMHRRSKVYSNMSPAAVVKAVAADLSLTPKLTGLESPTANWAQYNESDLAFLRRLLAMFDADLQIVDKELHVSPRGDVRRGGAPLELALYGQLQRARVIADLSAQATAVTTRGWDAINGSAVKADTKSGTHLGPGSGKTGADVLRQTLGARSEHVGHFAVSTNDEATALTQAAFDQRARRFLRVEATTEGNPRLRVGTHVTVTGLGTQFDNTFYVVCARHLFDMKNGYRTEFTGECAYMGGN